MAHTETRPFHLGDILTVASGIYCTPNGMPGVAALCRWMTGEETVMVHQLPRFSRECEEEIYRQHPDLRQIGLREGVKPPFSNKTEGLAWLAGVTARYGEYREITPLPAADHTSIDPIAEAKMANPGIMVVEL